MENDTSESFDPFVVAETDLSAHMDSVVGQIEGLKGRWPNDDSDLFPFADKDWIEDDLFGKMSGLDNKKMSLAESSDPVVQANDGFSSHLNDHDPGVDEEDWFNYGNWHKSSADNTAVSQQTDELHVFDKHNN
nr:hypothetical protein [Tanacetum cinerariifolium]